MACGAAVPGFQIEPVDGLSSFEELFAHPGKKWLVWCENRAREPLLDPAWARIIEEMAGHARLQVPIGGLGGTVRLARLDDRYIGSGARLDEASAESRGSFEGTLAPDVWRVFTTRLTTFTARATGKYVFVPEMLSVDAQAGDAFPVTHDPPEWWVNLRGRSFLALGPPGSLAVLDLVPVLEPDEQIPATITPSGSMRIRRLFPRSGSLWIRLTFSAGLSLPLGLELEDHSTGQHALMQLPPGELAWSPAIGHVLRSDPGLHEIEIRVTPADVERLEQLGKSAVPLRTVMLRLD